MDRAYRPFVPSEQNASRSDDGHIAGTLVEAKRLAEFEMWRQGDPELETAGAADVAGSATVPHSSARLHPLNGTSTKHASRAVGVFVIHTAFRDVSQCCDA